jgi:Flp pilus assembly pilin Flp
MTLIISLRRLLVDRSGATLVEYALILSLIAIAAIAAINFFGQGTVSVLSSAAASI